MLFKKIKNILSSYNLEDSRNFLESKITPEQLILKFGNDLDYALTEFNSLPQRYKIEFSKRIINFLKQYEFIDKTNNELTLKNKVLIAATYIKLTIGFKHYLINAIDKIVVYPTAQYFSDLNETHIGHYNPKYKIVMLTLDHFEADIKTFTGKNIAIHEFTHALCFEMLSKNSKHPDSRQFIIGYNKIKEWFNIPRNKEDIERTHFVNLSSVHNHLEFISELVECFFEKEQIFKELFPELYFYVGKMIKHPKTK